MKRISSALACNPKIQLHNPKIPSGQKPERANGKKRMVRHPFTSLYSLLCIFVRYSCFLTVLTIFLSYKVLQSASDAWVFQVTKLISVFQIIVTYLSVTRDGFWIHDRIYYTLWYSAWLHFTIHNDIHIHIHTLVSTVKSSLAVAW
jgi:hypothetical protein